MQVVPLSGGRMAFGVVDATTNIVVSAVLIWLGSERGWGVTMTIHYPHEDQYSMHTEVAKSGWHQGPCYVERLMGTYERDLIDHLADHPTACGPLIEDALTLGLQTALSRL